MRRRAPALMRRGPLRSAGWRSVLMRGSSAVIALSRRSRSMRSCSSNGATFTARVYNKRGGHLAHQPTKLRVPQTSAVGALDKLHFTTALRLDPHAFAHLLRRERVRRLATLRQIGERTARRPQTFDRLKHLGAGVGDEACDQSLDEHE